MPSSEIAIGIDLGTTNSCVAIYQGGEVEVIINSDGDRTTPSEVAFTEFERLVGSAAKNQAGLNPKNTIYEAKRMIGRNEDELSDIKKFPFKVVFKESKPLVDVEFKKERKQFTPEEISAMVLQKMKATAETYLRREVKDAVITVPAYFNDGQRQATKDAAKIAGLNVLKLINEPTAAAVAFGIKKKFEEEQKVLIYDFGGGTFDVSILTICPDQQFVVNATSGDINLGGSDVDQRMVEHFSKIFQKNHGENIAGNPRAISRLRTACEKAKKGLSAKVSETVVVEALYGGIDFECKLTRIQLEEMCSDLFLKTLEPVQRALDDAKLQKSDIDEIVLVGGSTRIPKVQQVLKKFFGGKALNSSINPDEAVAYGAAAQAAILSGVRFSTFGKLSVREVTPLSLGVNVRVNLMSTIVVRNTPIPLKKSSLYTTMKDNQTCILFKIYEGERSVADENHKLGEVELGGIEPLPRGKADVDVTFEIDEDGILKVTAVNRKTKKQQTVTIKKGRLNAADVDRMIKEAKKHEKEDALYTEKMETEKKIEGYVDKVRQTVRDNSYDISWIDKVKVTVALEKANTWLEDNKDASIDDLNSKLKNIKLICEPVIRNF